MRAQTKTVTHKKTKTLRGGATLHFTPPTQYGGVVNDATLDHRGRTHVFEPSTLQVIEQQIDAVRKRIDQDIEREKLARRNAQALAIIAGNTPKASSRAVAPAKKTKTFRMEPTKKSTKKSTKRG